MTYLDTPNLTRDELTRRCRNTIEQLVDAFAEQDIDSIMELFADDATYCDIRGGGQRGGEYSGKLAIRQAFARQFHLMGRHTFEAPTIIADGRTVFTSWTLVLGSADDPAAARFEGADHFELDEHARVTLKKAWLKGQPRLARKIMMRNPQRAFRYPAYALSG